MRLSTLLSLALVALLAAAGGGDAQGTKGKGKGKKPKDDKEAAGTVTDIGGKTIEQWLKDISGSDPSKSVAAIKIIPGFGPGHAHKVVRAMLDRIKKHKGGVAVDASVRANIPSVVMAILTSLKEPDADLNKEAIETFTTMITDPQIAIRMRAMQTLIGFGPMAKIAIPKLIDQSKDPPTWETRHTAVQALGIIGWDKKGPTSEVAKALFRAAKLDNSAQVRLGAIASIERLGIPDSKEHKTDFKQAMEYILKYDLDPIVKINAQLALYEVKEKDKAREKAAEKAHALRRKAIAKYLGHPETAVRAEAAKALGMVGDEACDQLPDLEAGIGDKDAAVSLACIHAIGLMKKCEEARAALGKVLAGKGEAFKRAEAARVLGGMGEDAKDQLKTVAAGVADKDTHVSAACIMALGGMAKLRDARKHLGVLLTDAEAFKRGEAAKGLGNAGPEAFDHLQALLKTMDDKDTAVAGWGIWAVGAIGQAAQPAVQQLQLIANDTTKPAVLQQAAKDAIDHITGKDKKKELKKKGASE